MTDEAGGNGRAVTEGASARLAEVIKKAAEKCAKDRDRSPYAVVIARNEIGQAGRIWGNIPAPLNGPLVMMDVEPDQRDGKQAVLLFKRVRHGEE